ncbi:PAS domain S-box protein [Natronorubrum halophilum]|uniref:PAS domain S-box protein n=1 Tax=Natronorubrum halophilum TaxID=1702106 RepID=UPI0010C16A01|nr:PAS domain S-box protein [Natronorubrum halophilum]
MSERAESPSTGFEAAGTDRTARRCYRTLLDAVEGDLFQLDDSERLVAVDDALLERTGYVRDDLLDTHVSRLVSATDADRIEATLRDQRRREGTDATALEVGLRTVDGTTVPSEFRLDTFRTDDGRHGAVGVVSEINECDSRAAPSQSSTAAEARYSSNSFDAMRTVLEAADVGVFVLDESFDVALVNGAAEEYFGIDPAAVLDRDKRAVLEDTIGDRVADPAAFSAAVLETYDDESYVDRVECHVTEGPNRDERWLEYRSKPIDSGPYAGGRIELYYDVSEQHRRAYQLRRLNEAVREWLEGTSDREVAERACHHLFDILDLEINGIYRYDSASRELRPIAWSEPADALFDDLPTFGEGEGIAWRVFDTGQAEIYSDVTGDPDVYNPETPVRSEICLPIGDYGVVLIGSEARNAFDDGDLSLAKVVASSLEVTFDRLRHERGLERRKSELETELSDILGRVSDAFYALDESWQFTHVNERAEDLLGYDREELLGENVWERFPGGTRSDLITQYHKAMRTQETLSWERYSGTLEMWMEIQAYPSETGLSVYFRDITDRKRREQQLERYERIIETVEDGIYALDENDRFTTVNEAYAELTGYDRDELLGAHASLVVDDAVMGLARKVAADESDVPTIDATLETKAGTRVPIEATVTKLPTVHSARSSVATSSIESLTLDGEGDTESYARVGVVRDVTDRKERQRRLEASEQRYRTLAENFPGGIVALFDDELRYTAAGGQLMDELGMERENVIGETIHDRYSDELLEKIEPHFRAALDGEERTFELNTHERELLVYTLPIRTPGERTTGMVVLRDVTAAAEYQRKLEESNERLEQFAYAASHDLQEPLRMVSSYLQLIERRYGDAFDEDGLEFLAFAVDGADRMSAMIEGLLAYSRVETQGSDLESVGLDTVCDDVREDLRLRITEKEADITVESLPRVCGDPDQLRQVFQNLLSNAIEYSGDEPPRVHISAERDGAEWLVSVRDEGIGMDPDDAEHVFEVFQRLHSHEEHPGTGIGLALCHRIIERHGGDIWVDTEAGDGSTFRLTLPALEDAE